MTGASGTGTDVSSIEHEHIGRGIALRVASALAAQHQQWFDPGGFARGIDQRDRHLGRAAGKTACHEVEDADRPGAGNRLGWRLWMHPRSLAATPLTLRA